MGSIFDSTNDKVRYVLLKLSDNLHELANYRVFVLVLDAQQSVFYLDLGYIVQIDSSVDLQNNLIFTLYTSEGLELQSKDIVFNPIRGFGSSNLYQVCEQFLNSRSIRYAPPIRIALIDVIRINTPRYVLIDSYQVDSVYDITNGTDNNAVEIDLEQLAELRDSEQYELVSAVFKYHFGEYLNTIVLPFSVSWSKYKVNAFVNGWDLLKLDETNKQISFIPIVRPDNDYIVKFVQDNPEQYGFELVLLLLANGKHKQIKLNGKPILDYQDRIQLIT